MGIATLPPDINHSEDHFTVEGDSIRFGLGAVKNVGHGLIKAVVDKRSEGGPFKSLEEFLERMEEGELNKRAVENFIKCGAMDCFGCHRSELLCVYDAMMDSVSVSRKKNLEGQIGLFSMLPEEQNVRIAIPHKQELPRAELMAMEKETTGIYISGHPMDDYRGYLKNTSVVPISDLTGEESRFQDEDVVSIGGIVQTVKTKLTRNNTMMAYVTIEDDTASIEMIAFSNTLNEYSGFLQENAALVVVGKLSLRDDKDPQIIVNRVRPISDFADAAQRQSQFLPREDARKLEGTLYLRLPTEESAQYRKVRAIVNMFPGDSPVVLFFADTRRRRGARCQLRDSMLGELKNLLGQGNVVLK